MSEEGGLTRMQGISFCFNLIVGCGFLSLPSVFTDSGWLMGLLLLLGAGCLLLTTALLEGETILRCSALKHLGGNVGDSANKQRTQRPSRGSNTELAPLRAVVFPNGSYTAIATSSSDDATAAPASATSPFPTTTTTSSSSSSFPSSSPPLSSESLRKSLDLLSRERTLEMTEVCDLLVGRRAKLGYCWMLLLYQCGTLWSYCSVFGSAAAGLLGVPFINGGQACDVSSCGAGAGDDDGGGIGGSGSGGGGLGCSDGCVSLYRFWLVAFALVATPLSVLEPKEQVCFQVCMTALRLAVVAAMVATVAFSALAEASAGAAAGAADPDGATPASEFQPNAAVAAARASARLAIWGSEAPGVAADGKTTWLDDPFDDASSSPSSSSSSSSSSLEDDFAASRAVPLAAPNSLFTSFSIMVFAVLVNAQMGMLTASLADKRGLGVVVTGGLALSVAVYLLVALVVGLYFGPGVDGSCNVTWSEYYWLPVRWLVVGFPALDVLSVYPMNVIIAANNLMAIVYDAAPLSPLEQNISTIEGEQQSGGLEMTLNSGSSSSSGKGGRLEAWHLEEGDEIKAITGGGGGGGSSSRSRSSSSSSIGGGMNSSSSSSISGSRGVAAAPSPLSAALASPAVRGWWRLVVAAPSLVLAAQWWTLDEILACTGVIGMLLAFVIPAYLYPLSRAACADAFGPSAALTKPLFLPGWLAKHDDLDLDDDDDDDDDDYKGEEATALGSGVGGRAEADDDGLGGARKESKRKERPRISFVRGVLVFGVAMAVLALLDTIVIDAHIDTTGWV